jgi:sigma-B regulation protein RsbU (phosphoserine phosphatase)
MTETNYNDLQATQFVIALFERSKTQSEEALESLPGIYAVVDKKGRILKGNKTLSSLFNTTIENLLDLNINHILDSTNTDVLTTAIETLSSSKLSNVETKIDVKAKDGSTLNYLWDVRSLEIARTDLPKLFSIVGRDVTDLTKATEVKTRMQMELSTARLVQERLFLPPIANFGNSSIAGHYEPATECGGDWWHYCMMKDKLFLWIGDVTGHGVPSALVVSAINSAVSTISGSPMTPAQALTLLNRIVFATAKSHLAMTFFIASIDFKTLECTYASAAHEPAILLRHGKETFTVKDIELLESEPGFPLGITGDRVFTEQKVQLGRGDRLFLYTDGLRDVTSPSGSKWENLRFYRTLAPLATEFRKAEDLVYGVTREIDKFREGTPLIDDVTFAVFSLD